MPKDRETKTDREIGKETQTNIIQIVINRLKDSMIDRDRQTDKQRQRDKEVEV